MEQRKYSVAFSGTAKEYFGIWIVNILLSIVTLGIYSAWAKVRTKRYFAQHTSIDGRRFDYHATGGQILIGRLIVVGGYFTFNFFVLLVPDSIPFLAVGILVAIPWILNGALRFNARMTSWSGLYFKFKGNYWKSALVFLVYPIILPLLAFLIPLAVVFGLLWLVFGVIFRGAMNTPEVLFNPVLIVLALIAYILILSFFILSSVAAFSTSFREQQKYMINGHSFGTAIFKFHQSIGAFFKPAAKIILIACSVFLALVIISLFALIGNFILNPMVLLTVEQQLAFSPIAAFLPIIIFFLVLPVFLFGSFAIVFAINAYFRNALFAGSTLEGGCTFESTVSPWKYASIHITNFLLIIISFGLLVPYTKIRIAGYLAANTFVIGGNSFDEFVASEKEKTSALGDAYADLEGIDIGVAI